MENHLRFDLELQPGETILDAALKQGVMVDHVCGGNCNCCTCHVVVHGGYEQLQVPDDDELERMMELGADKKPTSRLACQTYARHVARINLNIANT